MKKGSMTIMPIRSEESKRLDAKEAVEILIKAEEIRADKELMGQVGEELKKKKKVINSIDALREAANGNRDEDESEDDEDAEDFPEEEEPEVEESREDGDVLKAQDESRIQIGGPAVKQIYTKPKK